MLFPTVKCFSGWGAFTDPRKRKRNLPECCSQMQDGTEFQAFTRKLMPENTNSSFETMDSRFSPMGTRKSEPVAISKKQGLPNSDKRPFLGQVALDSARFKDLSR
jgi:hypothetical protein